MNEAKDNKGDAYEQTRPGLVGIDAVQEPLVRARAQIEPRLERGELQLEPRPLGSAAILPSKRKLDTGATEGASVSKKPRTGDEGNVNPVGSEKIPRAQDASEQMSHVSNNDYYESVPIGDVGFQTFGEGDVLCGRGGATNVHPGNLRFRKLVDLNKQEYLAGNKETKQRISMSIVKTIRREGGRFLKQWTKDEKWYEVGDASAREKASQALRQKTHERRLQNDGKEEVLNQRQVQAQRRKEIDQMQHQQQQRWEELQRQRQLRLQNQHQQRHPHHQQQETLTQQQQAQQQELLRQQQTQEEQMAFATASRLGTVAIDPTSLMSADPLVLQQALANPVFRALLAMNKVVVPVHHTTTSTSTAPMASMPVDTMNLQGMGLPAPPVLGGIPPGEPAHPVLPTPQAPAITPSPVPIEGNPHVLATMKQPPTGNGSSMQRPRGPSPKNDSTIPSTAPTGQTVPTSTGYDPLHELNLTYTTAQSPPPSE